MATKLAIFWQFPFQFSLTVLVTVFSDLAGEVVRLFPTITPAVISTIEFSIPRDASSAVAKLALYKQRFADLESTLFLNLPSANYYPLRFYQPLLKMADNLRRAVQEINLGVDDEPFALPEEIVNQAVVENRFILFGRPVMPRRQNLRSIVASMPRIWGQAGFVHGRIMEGRQFQFIFPTEESMEAMLRRGPWAFNDRMLLLQRWEPQVPLLNFIPFWIQIRGIPFQFLNRGVVEHIGRALGQVLDVDFDVEAVARVDFVRVLVHWDIPHPLRFQRNFQFSAGANTLLRFRYERLRGFCEVCGMLTHDSGACLIQNGGEEQVNDDDDDGEEQPPQGRHQNQGVVIREINDDEPMENMDQNGNNAVIQEAADNQNDANQAANDGGTDSEEEELSDIDPHHDALEVYEHYDMFSEERNDSELFNPIPIFENSCGDIPGSASHSIYSQVILPLALMDSEGVINLILQSLMIVVNARGKMYWRVQRIWRL